MLKRSKINTAVLLALGVVSNLPVLAQAPAQRVEITGSNIRRADAETSSPIQIIQKADIDQSGKSTVSEFLQTLTADGQGSVPFTYGRGFSGATSSGISLRGLGTNATLVLINGRRVAPAVLADDAQRGYTDLNQIPLEAVDRIEVLKDGSSAVYGSDAVAGVVNIILKKSFTGIVAKVTYGLAEEGDGKEPRLALTAGFGDLDKDGYNALFNLEYGNREAIYYRDRAGRNAVGVSALGQPQWGLDPNAGPNNNIARYGGNGWIPVTGAGVRVNNLTSTGFIGNVRNPTTLDYYSRSDPAGLGFTKTFPAASTYCLNGSNLPQNNPAGGCINDMRMAVSQVQPEHETGNLYGRFTKKLNATTQAWVEAGYYTSKTTVDGLPAAASAGYFKADGTVNSQTAITQLGAAHPDNPYFGTAARLSYQGLYDNGVAPVDSESKSARLIAGIQGTAGAWDYDAAATWSEVKQTDISKGLINWRVKNALLNPIASNVAAATAFSPAYAALPAGTYWRIGENAGLNSPEVYNALLSQQERSGFSKQYGIDGHASREIGKLDGGAISLAVGAEFRREEVSLPLYNGLGDYTGLSLTTYGGKRDVFATFAEVLLPVTKTIELNLALRYDDYSDAGTAWTPKIGAKWKVMNTLALRGSWGQGFRAPGFAENGASSIAAFGGATVDDNARCASLAGSGLPQATIDANCLGVAPTFVQRGNPNLEAEKSDSGTLGIVWDVTPKLSLTADLWQIKRTGLPVIEDPQLAVDAGRVVRDPATLLAPGDLGAILNGSVVFQNSDKSLTNGIDIEVKHRWDIGNGMGQLTSGVTWTHMFEQTVTSAAGIEHKYAGTHGNCDITNCIGSPKDRISFAATWAKDQWRLGANVNYRSSMSNKGEQSDTDCLDVYLNGEDAPSGCKVGSFTTVDLSGTWQLSKNASLFGTIQNLLDAKPPLDVHTYGAIGYNPLDYSGAIGRFYRVGFKYQF